LSKIIIVGPGASGKDYLRKKFEQKGWKYATTYTTRPIRKNEDNGSDYEYVDVDEFIKLAETDYFMEWCQFNGWYYGTPKHIWDSSNLFIMTPGGLSQIKENVGLDNVFVLYLNPSEEIRYKRLSSRGDADTPKRRIAADVIDFKDFSDYDMQITEANF
jgi:guanylate kinase